MKPHQKDTVSLVIADNTPIGILMFGTSLDKYPTDLRNPRRKSWFVSTFHLDIGSTLSGSIRIQIINLMFWDI
jgi:hypothetical protein